jgi:hypothetical protein
MWQPLIQIYKTKMATIFLKLKMTNIMLKINLKKHFSKVRRAGAASTPYGCWLDQAVAFL